MRGRVTLAALPVALVAVAATARADEGRPDGVATEWATSREEPVQPWVSGFLDPHGYTRLNVASRATFADGDSAFSSNSAWALEGRFQLDTGGTTSAFLVAPLAVLNREPFGADVYFGNLTAGFVYGGDPAPRPGWTSRWAVGVEVTAPTAARPDDDAEAARLGIVPAIRAHAPQLYVPRLFAMHARGHYEIVWRELWAALEVGLAPGVVLGRDGGALLLLSTQARVGWSATPTLEPFLEVGTTRQVAGAGAIAPPVWVTPGVRLHLGEHFHPSFSLSMNFEEATAVVFGLDLAALFPPAPTTKDPDVMEEFLLDDDW